jgi:hypothetical protein
MMHLHLLYQSHKLHDILSMFHILPFWEQFFPTFTSWYLSFLFDYFTFLMLPVDFSSTFIKTILVSLVHLSTMNNHVFFLLLHHNLG